MQKQFLLFLSMITLCSCSSTRDGLYKKHLKSLIDEEYTSTSTYPFDVTGRYKDVVREDKTFHQMELIFDRAQFNMHKVTFLMVDSRQSDYKDSALNFGYYKSLDFTFIDASSDISDKDQRAFRFSWLSDINNPTLKCVMSYTNNRQLSEIYFTFSQFTLYQA